MAARKGGLGKGLDSLIKPNTDVGKAEDITGLVTVNIREVEPNRNQPRKYFNEDRLEELADSIRQNGIVEPLLVQKKDNYYEIVAGERRWRAAKKAGIQEVPIIIKELTDQEVFEISLIENIQREQLNPIEEAQAYKRLLDEFSLTQEEIAKKVSKSRTVITNAMRLLKLDERVQQMVISGELAMGHARAILGIDNLEEQFTFAKKAVKESLTAREVEKFIRKRTQEKEDKQKQEKRDKEFEQMKAVFADLENHLKDVLGTKVTVNAKELDRGTIEIEYYSKDQLDMIIEKLDA